MSATLTGGMAMDDLRKRLGGEPPVETLDVLGVRAAVEATPDTVLAIEALWDGDTSGWLVELVAIVDRPGREHPCFDQVMLGRARHGGDIRVFNEQVPPWPEAVQAEQVGGALAGQLNVPFHFASPGTPDIDLARWWDGRPPIIDLLRYQYVGPAELTAELTGAVGSVPGGHRVTSPDDLAAWMAAQPPADRDQPHTFVIDVAGDLLIAPRRSEHVACAGGRPVLSAGEITFTGQGRRWSVSAVSNQSTGYCPEPSSWPAVAAACVRAGIEHPGWFTSVFDLRRCPACRQINIVKDGDFVCAACGGELPIDSTAR